MVVDFGVVTVVMVTIGTEVVTDVDTTVLSVSMVTGVGV